LRLDPIGASWIRDRALARLAPRRGSTPSPMSPCVEQEERRVTEFWKAPFGRARDREVDSVACLCVLCSSWLDGGLRSALCNSISCAALLTALCLLNRYREPPQIPIPVKFPLNRMSRRLGKNDSVGINYCSLGSSSLFVLKTYLEWLNLMDAVLVCYLSSII
jgi:hypothetical protein